MTMRKGQAGVTLVADVNNGGSNLGMHVQAQAIPLVVERDYKIVASDQWPVQFATSVDRIVQLEALGMTLLYAFPGATKMSSKNDQFTAAFDLTTMPTPVDAIAEINLRWNFSVSVAAPTLETAFKALDYFKTVFERHVEPLKAEEPKSPVNFWMMGQGGPASFTRTLDVTTWDQVQANYPAKVRPALEALVKHEAGKSGQIIMLHGDPGAGKTFFLRTLAWEWRQWCTIHYVMDPEQLLNGSPAYINELLFARGGPEMHTAAPPGQPRTQGQDDNEDDMATLEELAADSNGDVPFPEVKPTVRATGPPQPQLFGGERWRLLIMEDTGELLTADAGQRNGQGLGRLLNAADGMLGQGSRVLFLITTNEPLEKIHPAINRPGRCLSNILFEKFKRKEAEEWAEAKGLNPSAITNDMTIAELFAFTEKGQKVITGEKKSASAFGFSGGSK